ncbi:invasion associated locus B family protein [Devosia neptuniae]|uniref:invasion associated locus B family protein n=1 Tax=Devosia neptuniae TaxID=191302 RepID=UPI0036F196A9
MPNGASSITETFGDWTVNCAIQNNQKVCATSQAQGDSQTGQQVFAIELYASQRGARSGVLVLPFGLDIQSPVTLKIDEQALGSGAKFTTCVPGGCIVPVIFPPDELEALKRGTTLTVAARSASAAAEPAEFSVSLSGFTAVLGRVDQLTP